MLHRRRYCLMLRTATTNLPPEQQRRLHPDFLANEADYLRLRDSLLGQHRGQWVAVHGGRVIAASKNLPTVTEKAAAAGGHPYIAFVGDEEKIIFRVRRAEFNYDTAYLPIPLPRLPGT